MECYAGRQCICLNAVRNVIS